VNFKDHFSGHAGAYRDARPHYDASLFEWLAKQVSRHELALDVGCGNGQATVALAAHFDKVVGTEPSAAQIANAEANPKVEYRVEAAEACSLPDASADLVTVAQALHWFDHERFYAQVRRVLRPGGLIAAWCYASCSIDPAIDAVTEKLYVDITGPYWPPERSHIDAGYATIPFPFEPVDTPEFDLVAHWNLAEFLAYLRSWSATQRYIKANGDDPVTMLEPEFAAAWKAPGEVKAVRWKLTVKAGRR
jgi:SAM-dependent methyltransferase